MADSHLVDVFKSRTLLRKCRLQLTGDMIVFPFVSVTAHGVLILQLERRQDIMLCWPMYMKFSTIDVSSCNNECLPSLDLLAHASDLEIFAVKLFTPSAVPSHLLPYCCEKRG